jgi:hypothetical protein
MGARRQRNLGAALAVAICLMVMLPCIFGGVALRRGLIAPPTLEVRLGGYRMVGFPISILKCPEHQPTCPVGSPEVRTRRFYTVLLFVRRGEPGRSSEMGWQLLDLRLDH